METSKASCRRETEKSVKRNPPNSAPSTMVNNPFAAAETMNDPFGFPSSIVKKDKDFGEHMEVLLASPVTKKKSKVSILAPGRRRSHNDKSRLIVQNKSQDSFEPFL